MRIHKFYGAVEDVAGSPHRVRTLAPVARIVERGDDLYSQSELPEGSELDTADADFVTDEAPHAPRLVTKPFDDLPMPERMKVLSTAAGLPDGALEALLTELRAALLSFGERRALKLLERQLQVRRERR